MRGIHENNAQNRKRIARSGEGKSGGMTEAEMRDFDRGCLIQEDTPPAAPPPGAVQLL